MPESPEVDALAGFLRERARGRRIASVELDEFRALKTRARPLEELVGASVTGVRRFGKHLSLDTDGADLVVSFGRAGWATWTEPEVGGTTDVADSGSAEVAGSGPADVAGSGPADVAGSPSADAAASASGAASSPPAPEIARVRFDDGAVLALTDGGSWLSLGLAVVDDPHEVAAIAKLGPDPADPAFARAELDAALGTRRKQLKALLQEQESLAGIGNAYSDEILHAARLSPVVHAIDLDDAARERLRTAMRDVLGEAIAARRDIPIARQKAAKVAAMRVHGRTGEPCPVCGGTVLDIPGSKAAAQYCPICQTGGVPLED